MRGMVWFAMLFFLSEVGYAEGLCTALLRFFGVLPHPPEMVHFYSGAFFVLHVIYSFMSKGKTVRWGGGLKTEISGAPFLSFQPLQQRTRPDKSLSLNSEISTGNDDKHHAATTM